MTGFALKYAAPALRKIAEEAGMGKGARFVPIAPAIPLEGVLDHTVVAWLIAPDGRAVFMTAGDIRRVLTGD